MRLPRVLAALLAAVGVASCGLVNRYSSSAATTTAYPVDWAPLGKDQWYQLTSAEEDRRRLDLEDCVRMLASSHEHELKPTREERLIQIFRCMETKGWHIVRYEVVVTS
jgi:hypothetical protein